MVTSLDISRHQVRELCRGNLLALYKAVLRHGDMRISIFRRWAITHLIKTMAEAGLTDTQIAAALDMRPRAVRLRKNSPTPKAFQRTLKLFGNPLSALKASREWACEVYVSRQFVEYLLIEDMARAGWTTRQIVAATGFGERRVQRIVKKIREEQE
ncbi:hypothetical protein Nitsa_1176 [Nitratifractor salsuginis DSM 16511]|uniref:Uncharacterized protein n=1 Tax=Nitratifractor salsuginis (strain DSM 16511 / JCM 12458 / E9I37-1) TaxID=749222 RepID=E6WY55_NITSE|nr:hypothetical protein Nitsa_1176 [Nitratifractor salsuginis DSM 16511]